MPDSSFLNNDVCISIDLISHVGQMLQSARTEENTLSDIVNLVSGLMRVDACSIFLYHDGALQLQVMKGIFGELPGGGEVELGEGPIGEAALRGKLVEIVDDHAVPEFMAHYAPGPLRSILSVPMMDGDNLTGVLSLHNAQPREYSDMEQSFVAFIASQLVGSIRNAQMQDEILRGLRDMATLYLVGKIVSSVLDVEELMDLITQTCASHLHARGCMLRMLVPGTDILEVRSVYGIPMESIPNPRMPMGMGIAGKVAREMKPFVSTDLESEPGVSGETGVAMKSIIGVPLMVKGRLLGTLGVFDRTEHHTGKIIPFDESDVGLVSSIGTQVAMALENARLFEESRLLSSDKETRINELSLVLEITNIMRGTLDLEEILYIILTSVTMGQGLGFNRACLFFAGERSVFLVGKMAVGPSTGEEARRHWDALNTEGKSLAELIKEAGRYNMQAGFEIDHRIRQVRIPLKHESGILARTAIDQHSFNVEDYRAAPGADESVLADLDFTTFASVPLIAKDRVIGVIVVDNFITREPITEEMIDFLQLFANQVASAIEMTRVYRNLEETNRHLVDAKDLLVRTKTLATLGEFSAGVAHELRNPLVSIGGFARRLTKLLDSDTREAKYARIIATEVENLERILSQILEFVSGGHSERRRTDIVLLLEQVFLLFQEQLRAARIEIATEFDDSVRELWVDEIQIRQLFINLIKNAIEAMNELGGTLKVKSIRMADENGGVGFEVADTGCGIESEDLDRIFDPFFSKKNTGTGLGLSMCSRIVEANHGGRIFVDSKKGIGTSVLVWFPEEAVVRDNGEAERQEYAADS